MFFNGAISKMSFCEYVSDSNFQNEFEHVVLGRVNLKMSFLGE